MTIRPRTWWLAGGCGCALVGLLVVGAAFLWYIWPNPAPPRKPPTETRSETPEPDDEAPVVGRTVYSGQLEPGRDVTIPCDSTLTVTVPAGVFTRPERVTVKLASVGSRTPATIAKPLASYDVTIGKGGPLARPLTLSFRHRAVPTTRRLVAARFDPERESWEPLEVTRISDTSSAVETDHLCVFVFGEIDLDFWESFKSADGKVTVHMLKSVVPTLETLYSREGDPDPPNSDLSPKARRERLKATLDRQARLERALPRDTDAEKQRLFASVVAEMVARVRKAYARLNFPAPATLSIWVDSGFDEPTYVPAWGGEYIGVPPHGHDRPETLAFNLAHEVFHACQHGAKLGSNWMRYMALGATEASAEYAAGRMGWADLGDQEFGTAGVVLSKERLRGLMGDGIRREFLTLPLTDTYKEGPPVQKDHAYHGAHLLDFLFKRSAKLDGLFDFVEVMKVAGTLDGSEQILQAYGQKDGTPFDKTWSDFVAFLLLDKASPATGGLKGPQFLRAAEPSWSGPLVLPGTYTGTHETFTMGAQPGQPETALLKLSLESQGGGAPVVVYRLAGGRLLDLQRDLPAGRADVSSKVEVLTVPLKRHELVVVVASRGGGADPQLTLRAELTTLAVSAEWLHDSTLRLEVKAPATPPGPSGYRWDTGDPRAAGAIETRTNTLDHTYSRPGEHEVRVTLLEGTNGEPAGEAVGRVTVPSTLQITVKNLLSGRPLGGATVRVQYEGKTKSWTTDPLGVGHVEGIPPRKVPFTIDVTAEGFLPYSRTGEIDMSGERVVPRKVQLVPVVRRSTPRPAEPTTEPRPPATPPEPTTTVPTPTTKAPPETSSYEACMAPYRQQLEGVRAHNRTRDPASRNMTTKVMGADRQCSAAFEACLAAVKERRRPCPAGPDGTYDQCDVIENRGWLDCANAEVDCCERALEAKCRKQ